MSINRSKIMNRHKKAPVLPEMPNSLHSFRHRFAGEPARHKLQPFVHHGTLLPAHHSLPKRGESVTHVSGTFCYLCLRPLK